MRRFLAALVILASCCSMAVCADETVEQPPAAAETGESSDPVIVQVTPEINVQPTPIEITSEGTKLDLYITFAAPEPEPLEDVAAADADLELESEPVIPPDVYALTDLPEPDGLAQVVISVFGAYRPRIQTVTSVDAEGAETVSEYIVPGLAGLDWPWIVGVGLFAILLHGFLILIGVLLKHG